MANIPTNQKFVVMRYRGVYMEFYAPYGRNSRVMARAKILYSIIRSERKAAAAKARNNAE